MTIGSAILCLGRRFARDESGATAIEYALIASIISIVIIGGSGSIRSALRTTFNSVANSVGNVAASS
jgi:pilus assembly protein Flp/PilA